MINSIATINSYIEKVNEYEKKISSIFTLFDFSDDEFKELLLQYNKVENPSPDFISINLNSYDKTRSRVNELRGIEADLNKVIDILGKIININISSAYNNLIDKFVKSLNSRQIDYAYSQYQAYQQNINNEYVIYKINAIFNVFNHGFISDIQNTKNLLGPIFIFSPIKEITTNITLIGTNGSGKSRFSRELISYNSNPNFIVIAAQHYLGFNKETNINIENAYRNLDGIQKDYKLGNQSGDSYLNEFGILVEKLRTLNVAQRTKYKTDCEIFNKVANLFHELIPTRNIIFNYDDFNIYAKPGVGEEYDINEMSDGEKSILFYILHIVFSKEKSFIIVDEPENHLHSDICMRLWDKLEEIRPESIFIYLSHNIDFITTRKNSTTIWNKKFNYPKEWDFEILEDNELPKQLYYEILGSTPPVLLCEGKENSKDVRIYQEIFKEYKVRPCEGCDNVKKYVRTIKDLDIFKNKTVNGIVDLDFRSQKDINNCVRDGIFVLKVIEIENLLFVPELLDRMFAKYSNDEQKALFIDKFYKKASEELEHMVNRALKDYFVHDIQDKKGENFFELISDSYEENSFFVVVSKKRNEIKKEYQNIIDSKDYDAALSKFDFKNTLYALGNMFINDYLNKAISLLNEDSVLSKSIKNKYVKLK